MPKSWVTPSGMGLEYVRKLGEGTFGVALLVRTRHGKQYCLKEVTVKSNDDRARAEVMDEVACLQRAQHNNVVALIENWWAGSGAMRFHILMEFASNGSLDDIIKQFSSSRRFFPETKLLHFVQEIAEALSYCHNTLRLMHRDLKPANILVDQLGTLKLADFGLSKALTPGTNFCATCVGSPLYMAPEVINGEVYTFSADNWSLGCIAFELMSFRSPWSNVDGTVPTALPALIRRISFGRYDVEKRVKDKYSASLFSMVDWLLKVKSPSRATSQNIVDLLCLRSPPDGAPAPAAPAPAAPAPAAPAPVAPAPAAPAPAAPARYVGFDAPAAPRPAAPPPFRSPMAAAAAAMAAADALDRTLIPASAAPVALAAAAEAVAVGAAVAEDDRAAENTFEQAQARFAAALSIQRSHRSHRDRRERREMRRRNLAQQRHVRDPSIPVTESARNKDAAAATSAERAAAAAAAAAAADKARAAAVHAARIADSAAADAAAAARAADQARAAEADAFDAAEDGDDIEIVIVPDETSSTKLFDKYKDTAAAADAIKQAYRQSLTRRCPTRRKQYARQPADQNAAQAPARPRPPQMANAAHQVRAGVTERLAALAAPRRLAPAALVQQGKPVRHSIVRPRPVPTTRVRPAWA